MPIEIKRRSTIKLKDLEVSVQNQDGLSLETSVNELGKAEPYITFAGGLNIEFRDILEMKLFNNKFLPWIQMKFRDKTAAAFDDVFPLDNQIVSVFIRSTSEDYWPIRMDFKIIDFNPNKTKKGDNLDIIYELTGVLDVNYLYYKLFWSKKGTSYQVLEQISKDANLGWASNISNTEDEMTWINPAEPFQDFIKKITRHSFKSTETFLFSYIDFYYNLNYIDIEQQLQEDISEQTCKTNYNFLNTDNNEDQTIPIKLTNHPDYNMTNLYIDTFSIDNASTKVNLRNGYRVYNHYYDKKKVKYTYKMLDSISDVGDGTKIVLKDQPGQNEGLTKFVRSANYIGKLDTDNVHENYLLANSQNTMNLDFLQKIKMVVTLSQPNYSLYRFQKVLVELYKLSQLTADEQKSDDSDKLNKRLSGEWLITAINFTYTKNKGPVQEITLIKRELSANYDKRK